jgi:dTDP-4-dehydrorhamnose reductase
MKVLVTGAGGQLGRDLAKALAGSAEPVLCDRAALDVTDAEAVRRMMLAVKPDAVIHAAAYTQVDRAEIEPDEAYRVNALGTRNVAVAAAEAGAKLACVSTDYVFDGKLGRPYRETDPPAPINAYGRSKLEGERFVRHLHHRSFIVRTSWLYGGGPNNFVGKILRAAREGRTLRVVGDEIGSPTYTADLAGFLAELVRTNLYGTYHAANTGFCSRYEQAVEVLRLAGLAHVPVTAINSAELSASAPRPKFSALDPMMIRLSGLKPLPDWRDALARCLAAH